MASMSLKVDHDQTGTNMAGLLSKALITDPSDAIAIEKMKSDLMTAELTRRHTIEATSLLTQQTIDQAMKNKRESAAWNSLFPAAEAATSRTYDSLDQSPQVQAAIATAPEPPAVVTDPAQTYAPPVPMLPNFYPPVPDTSAPTPTVDDTAAAATAGAEPDFEYRISNYPLRAEEPVPIELPDYSTVRPEGPIGALPAAPLVAPSPGAQYPSVFAARPGGPTPQPMPVREDIGAAGAPLISLDQGRAVNLPEEPMDTGQMARANNGSWLDALLQPLGPVATNMPSTFPARPGGPTPQPMPPIVEEPVPVEQIYNTVRPEARPGSLPAAEYVNTVRPEGPAGSLPAGPAVLRADSLVRPALGEPVLPEPNLVRPAPPPLPLQEEPVPVEQFGPPQPDQVITLPGRQLPETAAPDAVVTAATPETPPPTASPVSPTTPTVPITPAVVEKAAATTAAATKGVDDGKGDTADTVETKRGTVTRDEIKAEITAIYLNAKNPAEAQQAIQRLEGDLGITYDERVNVGPTGDPNATIAAYTRAGGGTALSKDAAAAQAGSAAALPGTAPGTGKDAWISNTFLGVQDAIRSGKPPAPSVADAYAQAYLLQSQPTQEMRADDKGQLRMVTIPGIVDPRLPSPDAVRAWANGTGPAPVVGAAGAAAPAAVPATAAGGGGAAAAGANAPVGTTTGGATVSEPLTEAEKKPQTAEASSNEAYYGATKAADTELRALQNADMPSSFTSDLTDPTIGGGTGGGRLGSIINSGISATMEANNPGLKRYWGAAMAFASPILRKESGAATRPEDMKTILRRYVPLSDDPPDVVAAKALRRELAVEALKGGFIPVDNENHLAQVDAYVDANIEKLAAARGLRIPDAAPPAAATDEKSLIEKHRTKKEK